MKTGYDLRVSPTVLAFKPAWFDQIPWDKCRLRKLDKEDIHAISYMDTIEGHVCAGYVHLALAPFTIRAKTQRTDFVIAWGAQQNWHGISLHRFLDQYKGKNVSTRIEFQDANRDTMPFFQKHSILFAGLAASVLPYAYTAIYACLGYRNELMTMHGYGSLRSIANKRSVHPVLDPLLTNIMSEEAVHARYYKQLAEEVLTGRRAIQKITRKALGFWFGTVGENFAGKTNADRIIRHLFRDSRGITITNHIDEALGKLPGLAGIHSMRDRVNQAFSRSLS